MERDVISRRQLSASALKSQQVPGQLLTNLNLSRKQPTFCQSTLLQIANTQLSNHPPKDLSNSKGCSANSKSFFTARHSKSDVPLQLHVGASRAVPEKNLGALTEQ